MKIEFKALTPREKDIIFEWLDKPHVMKFWDNSQAYRDDIINFIEGRETKSLYFGGVFSYWVAFINDEPYGFLMTSELNKKSHLPNEYYPYLSKTGKTISIDIMIGNEKFLNQGLATPTLEAFCNFIPVEVDIKIDTFLIDPDEQNERAIRVYEKAGFKVVDTFKIDQGYFAGHMNVLMIKKANE